MTTEQPLRNRVRRLSAAEDFDTVRAALERLAASHKALGDAGSLMLAQFQDHEQYADSDDEAGAADLKAIAAMREALRYGDPSPLDTMQTELVCSIATSIYAAGDGGDEVPGQEAAETWANLLSIHDLVLSVDMDEWAERVDFNPLTGQPWEEE